MVVEQGKPVVSYMGLCVTVIGDKPERQGPLPRLRVRVPLEK